MGQRFAALLALILLASPAVLHAQVPITNLPLLREHVFDESRTLPESARARISGELAQFERASGHQIVVALLASSRGQAVSDLAVTLGRRWRVGRAGHDDGVLLLVVPSERVIHIAVGYGLEGSLTDAATKQIIETRILPNFRRNDFLSGIEAGIRSIEELLVREGISPPERPGMDRSAKILILVAIAGIAFWFAWVFTANFRILRRTDARAVHVVAMRAAGESLLEMLRDFLQFFAAVASSRGGGSLGSGSGGGRSTGFSGGGGSFGGGGASGQW